jgi:hypothetical protein
VLISPSPHLKKEADQVSKTLCFQVFRILDEVRKLSNSECQIIFPTYDWKENRYTEHVEHRAFLP